MKNMKCKEMRDLKILFAGNGFNFLNTNYFEWQSLMEKLLTHFIPDFFCDKKIIEKIPFRFINEIILGSGKAKNNYDIIKEVEKFLIDENIEPSNLHKKAVNAEYGYNEIITTNYDNLFEKAAWETKECFPKTTEKFYSLYRVAESEKSDIKKIWHPHGAITENKGIQNFTLWNNLYTGGYSKLRTEFINPEKSDDFKEEDEEYKNGKRLSKYVKEYYKENKEVVIEKDSWFYRFFFSDIDFIGYGFSFEENDIWSILSIRADLFRRYEIKNGNTIRFFTLGESEKCKMSDEEKAKVLLLEKLGVKIIYINPNDIVQENREEKFAPSLMSYDRGKLFCSEKYYDECFRVVKKANKKGAI